MSDLEADDHANYWPGYVDAIFNFALNILFVLALFVMLSSVIDFSQLPEPQTATTSPTPLDAPLTDRPLGQTPSVEPPVQQAEAVAAVAALNNPVVIHLPRVAFNPQLNAAADRPAPETAPETAPTIGVRDEGAEGPLLLTIDFAERVISLPPEQRQQLAQRLAPLQGPTPTEQPWVIWTQGNATEAAQMRLAYLRVMEVRSALIEAGLPAAQITVRILDVRDSGHSRQDQVFISTSIPQGPES